MNKDRFDLTAYHMYVSRNIPTILLDAKLDMRPVLDSMMATLTAYAWGEETQNIVIHYPSDWKEAFKDRWFRGWLLRRYPVKRTIRTVKVTAVAPNLKLAWPSEKIAWHVDQFTETENVDN